MNRFQISILAADSVLYEGACESLVVPTPQGMYGILAKHSNMISAVAPGRLSYRIPGGEEQYAAVSAGLVKVENNEVLVLVDTAERPEDIDVNRARRAADEAKEAILQKRSIREYRSAQANLAREINRLKVKRQYDDRMEKQ
ncbi:MAG: ATP synthase F1 subunit epsilon [Butyrivibrio sp.]|nr:ATP synthase F1 subunit epsilon [Acetatifactor muris]MCM1560412.1 ATP synthase F1 subunit epsilon [Butyrivibrio sp.]